MGGQPAIKGGKRNELIQLSDFNTMARPDWCAGCGNFGVLLAVKQALSGLQIDPEQVAYISDIGCSGKTPHWLNTYGLHSLHGRAIPCASGVKFANRDLTVLVSVGDGGAYGIGLGHLLQAIRRNVNITCLVHHNQVYGLTKGQMTPTSPRGFVSPSTPHGVVADPLNPLAVALSAGGTFVARGFAGNMPQLVKLIQTGLQHPGFALIDILQPCVTYNKAQTFDYYRENTYSLEEAGHDSGDWQKAMARAMETAEGKAAAGGKKKDGRLPLGIFYRTERPAYEAQDPGWAGKPAVELELDGIDIGPLLKKHL